MGTTGNRDVTAEFEAAAEAQASQRYVLRLYVTGLTPALAFGYPVHQADL